MASDPGFTDEIYQVMVTPGSQWLQVMYAKYEANLNIDGTGAIVAAPDLETPGMARISLGNLFSNRRKLLLSLDEGRWTLYKGLDGHQ